MERQYNKEWWLEDKKPITYLGQPVPLYYPPYQEGPNKVLWLCLDPQEATWKKVTINEVELHHG